MIKTILSTPARLVYDGEFYVSSGRLFRWDATLQRGIMIDDLDRFRKPEDRAVQA